MALAAAFAAAALAGARAAEKASIKDEIVFGPYLVADVATGQMIAEHDAVRPWYPASTTKLMTAYVAFEAVRDGEIALGDEVAYSRIAAAQPASKMGFRVDSTFTLEDGLKMMMVKSANDIAVAVAEAVGGSVEGFAERMNMAAERLGMTQSHFVNPNGLPDERQVTSARDMALLARALLREFPDRRPFYSLHAIEFGGKTLRNYNRLIDRYPGTTGMKTGFICASGYNLVATAERDGRELVAVVFGEYGAKIRNEHAAALLDSAFAGPVRRTEGETTLFNTTSGKEFDEPYDLRPLVCTKKRRAILAALSGTEDDSEDGDGPATHLTDPIFIGPPIKVTANIPAIYGEPGYIPRLPRPRPVAEHNGADVLEAFAPVEDASSSAPAEAIGAVTGEPGQLKELGDGEE